MLSFCSFTILLQWGLAMNAIHTLVISDVHLESADCRAELLLSLLQSCPFEVLIIAGDLYENGGVIGDEQFKLVGRLRELRKKLIYVSGNHDFSENRFVNRFIGVRPVKRYEWNMGQKRFYVVHGHQFDRFCFIFSEPVIEKLILRFFQLTQWMDPQKLHISGWIEQFRVKLSGHFAKRARKFAKKHGVSSIICGHTHRPDHIAFLSEKDGHIEYLNCGSWTEKECSLVTIDESGQAKLCCVSAEKGHLSVVPMQTLRLA